MKYIGSKARISKDITKILNKIIEENNIDTYIEPFVGGANVIDKVVCENKIGGDNNEYLISLWNSLKNGYKPIEFISREDYYDIKTNKEKYPKEVVALCGILASYNGNWFASYGGYSKTKVGKDRNYYAEGVKGLIKQIPHIKDVEFVFADYTDFSNNKNCLIYCDPPYVSRYKDVYSQSQGFNHNEFWNWVRDMSKNNIVIVSEYEAPNDFIEIWRKEVSKTHANQRNNSIEKLFIHKDLKCIVNKSSLLSEVNNE